MRKHNRTLSTAKPSNWFNQLQYQFHRYSYSIETVEDCVKETQTGQYKRTRACQIDVFELRFKLAAVHSVSNAERVNARIRVEDIEIDTILVSCLCGVMRLVAVMTGNSVVLTVRVLNSECD